MNHVYQIIPDRFRPSLNPARYWLLRPYDMRADSLIRRWQKSMYYQALWYRDWMRSPRHRLYQTFRAHAPEYFAEQLARDPSESVSGENIIPTLEKYFEIVEVRPVGGTIISWILDFDWTFDMENPDFLNLVTSILAYERDLIVSGKLSSDYASILVRNPK